jgi:hypothetical protein
MSRIWRWLAPAALAGTLAAGVAGVPSATAGTAATVSINATSPNYPGLRAKDHGKVDGYAVVIYRDDKNNANTATISGEVTTTAATDSATLLAQPFGTTSWTVVPGVEILTPDSDGIADYSFSVTPSRATKYQVQLADPGAPLSAVVTVYVTVATRYAGVHERCSRTECRYSYRLYSYVPTSKAYKTESGKHVYQYLAVGYPRLPKDYTLSKTATASKARKVNSGEYVQTFTYYIPLRNGSARWDPEACLKDSESKDGVGLPGHHGCGNKHVSRSAIYLG